METLQYGNFKYSDFTIQQQWNTATLQYGNFEIQQFKYDKFVSVKFVLDGFTFLQ